MALAEPHVSPFLHPGSCSSPSSLAVLHLKRDHLLPTFLSNDETDDSDYAEGPVTNTRFGSYPHSTLIGLPWGSQVLASQVDTGSRGRRDARAASKRQRSDDEGRVTKASKRSKLTSAQGEDEHNAAETDEKDGSYTEDVEDAASTIRGGAQGPPEHKPMNESKEKRRKTASAAASGYCHLLPPTPETWTISLPHRTQVVYTPDYSYILQKMQVRPGCVVLEAGAGSGSFTHAATRAVYNGYAAGVDADPDCMDPLVEGTSSKSRIPFGKVYSYEYHEQRASQLRTEIASHGLSSLVTVMHRDVYNSGFLLDDPSHVSDPSANTSTQAQISPNATHIFLDLPAPWQALHHITRTHPTPLNPSHQVHICIFLPCIEQVQRAVTALRTHSWVEITMQELSQRRIDVRRDRVGLDLEGLRGVNASPATVDEACVRLRQVEMHGRRYLNRVGETAAAGGAENAEASSTVENKAERLARISRQANENRSAFRQGRVVTRTEPEIRMHTSYLVFAVLPREWTAADEEAARRRWPVKAGKNKEGSTSKS